MTNGNTKGRIFGKCQICFKDISFWPCQKRKYCSIDCATTSSIRSELISKKNKNKIILPEQREKISDTLVKKYKNGEISSWSKGLTKETDERVKRIADKKIIEGLNRIYPIYFNKRLKKEIKIRDGYKCRYCFITNIKLFIHHIDYNKDDCNKGNLLSLCNSCHTSTNYKRNEWTRYFQSMQRSYAISREYLFGVKNHGYI